MPSAAPARASGPSQLATGTHLPAEILFSIFALLDNARDLYHSSLVNRMWRSVAIDDHLWESHYWRFYRPIYSSNHENQPDLQLYFERKRQEGMQNWLKGVQHLPAPPFFKPSTGVTKLPEFYNLFRLRLAADDGLLNKLAEHLQRTRKLHADLRGIIHDTEYCQATRPLLAAIVATQSIQLGNVEQFLPADLNTAEDERSFDEGIRLRAFDCHMAAAQGRTLPSQTHCLDLYLAALKSVWYFEHIDAVCPLYPLDTTRESYDFHLDDDGSVSSHSRDQLLQWCQANQDAMEAIALFRSGDTKSIGDYIDLLALFVWSEVHASDANAAGQNAAQAPAYPQSSTRHLLAGIVTSLRQLGFGIADGAAASDTDNAFIHTALYCPSQRRTSPLTFAAIICAVAQRLGVAATISQVASPVLILAVEDDCHPAALANEAETAQCSVVFVDVRDHHRCVREIGEVRTNPHGQGQRPALTVASSVAVLKEIALNVLRSAESEGPVSRSSALEDRIVPHTSSDDSLEQLRLFLEGQVPSPPWPLQSPALASSLALLPPTEARAVFKKPARVVQDAVYCAKWILKIVAPHVVGGLNVVKRDLGRTIAGSDSGAHSLDAVLLTRIEHPEDEQDDAPAYWLESLGPFLERDSSPAIGLGGAGYCELYMIERPLGIILPRRCLERRIPLNGSVRYGVGSVVKHRLLGWRGVVVGWDKGCRTLESWNSAVDQDGARSSEPYYHVITQGEVKSYEAQGSLEPVRIPAGGSRKDAVAILQGLVPLFHVRAFGRAFRTLRVEPWEPKAGVSESRTEKRRAKKEERKGAKKDQKNGDVEKWEKGQVYLEMSAWMREAWPYE